jgi:hypothetical protein
MGSAQNHAYRRQLSDTYPLAQARFLPVTGTGSKYT